MKRRNLKNIKHSGFKTPKGYFDDLEDGILSHYKLKQAAEDTGFKVPEGYFETLEDRVFNKIPKKDGSKVIPLFNKKRVIATLSIAASILLLFNLSLFKTHITFDSLDNESLENFILNQEIESSDMGNLISDYDTFSNSILGETVSDNTLENYLYNTDDLEYLLSE